MTKKELIKKIDENPGLYTKAQLLEWIKLLPNLKALQPTINRAGDIYFNENICHPIVLVKKVKENWVCVQHTSKETINSPIQAKSRFTDGYFYNHLMEIHESLITEMEFMGIYSNTSHLLEVYKIIKDKL